MVTLTAILDLLNRSKGKTLWLAECAMPKSQYRAFRKGMLDVFGRNGLERELENLFTEDEKRHRNGQE